MRIIYNYFYSIVLVSLTFCQSCKKFVEVSPPKNQLVNSTVFSDSANATAAVLGIYINMMQAFSLNISDGGLTLYPGLFADELKSTVNNTDEQEFLNNSISPNNNLNYSSLWVNAYSLIYNTNACLEGLNNSKGIPDSAKNHLIGEAKFARAFIFFNLVNLYGGIPLITSTDYHQNQTVPRAGENDVYTQIIKDLKEAQSLLAVDYITEGRLRPNQLTATALLAKVYLYQKNWALAESTATQIIGSGIYSLEPDLNNVFLSSSNEAIWKLSPVFPGLETWEGYFFLPSSDNTIPQYIISNYLLNAFENGDLRKANWLNSNTVDSVAYFYPYKYKLGYDGLSIPNENYVVFRLAEQYLIRAEARAWENKLSDALDDLNVIRNRAGLPNTNATGQVSILSAIFHERQVELFCEWGNRWFDLKRTGTADLVLSAIKPRWQKADTLFPIPQPEINSNPFLTQNPGY